MRTLWTCTLVALLLFAASALPGLAQNDDDDPMAQLQTVVAEQGEQIDRLEERVATLEAGGEAGTTAEPTGQAGGDENATEEAETEINDDGEATERVSRDEPVALGDEAEVGGWSIRVLAYESDATDLVLAEEPNNPDPGQGRQYVLITIEAINLGDSAAAFYFSSSWALGDEDGIIYEEFEDGCAFAPDGFTGRGDTPAGETIEGNLCFNVEAGDAESLLLYIRPLGSTEPGENVIFALTEED